MKRKLDDLWNEYPGIFGKQATKSATPLAVATAAGAAVFGLQPHAEANIVYSGIQNITASIGSGTGQSVKGLNLDSAGGVDFQIKVYRFAATSLSSSGFAQLIPGANNAFIRNNPDDLRKLNAGSNISAGAVFQSLGAGFLRKYGGGTPVGGTWAKSQSGFAGVRFVNGGNTFFGWIRLKWTDSPDGNPAPNTITAIDWAYNDTPNAPILAGQVPEPSSALLFLAGAGVTLAGWRLRKSRTK